MASNTLLKPLNQSCRRISSSLSSGNRQTDSADYAIELATWKRTKRDRGLEQKRIEEAVDNEELEDFEECGITTDPEAYENVPTSGAYITVKETKPQVFATITGNGGMGTLGKMSASNSENYFWEIHLIPTVFLPTLFCRRLLILLSCRCRIEESKDTASAVFVRHDSVRCVWLGIGRSGPVAAGSLA
ncbi:hypothetical protein [Natronoglomus mannanivorans]|uniref:Uncharacterized protein n=1 Tax=Natronoglomus mannanivorans TaxID=2979990 RepID=A0AAP3E3F2_9EURY|nr:hypothetical protein [Halobacteria archaeon AArc-xg1-1]